MKQKAQKRDLAAPPASPIGRARLIWFRLLAAVGVPLILLGLLEVALRVFGFGYPTAFLLPSLHHGQRILVQNNQFGWRFFGPAMARTPAAICLPEPKPPGTVRIFVLGESAAFGDPAPRFGLPRMLQAMLELRFPGVRFEVVNAAMTGINSQVLLPIARDCAQAEGDIWVIYMGNNEVVGPFGAGTVFGSQTLPLALIRANLAMKATRTGQLLDGIYRAVHKPPASKSEWGGMEMFLNQQVPFDDARLKLVDDHFQKNLADMIRAGRQRGAGIVVSTVAVNLKDCAPFASAHRTGLPEADKTQWEDLYQSGRDAEAAGRWPEAAGLFQRAGQSDGSVAELRFREGQCDLALDQAPAAQQDFTAARDLDTLRFRCDSTLNDLIRKLASGRESERILFADAARAFADQSADGLPGDDLFYEHVHLTFAGNYLLARTLMPQIEKLLPAGVISKAAAGQPWPTETECAGRLAWLERDRKAAFSDIYTRLLEPPFTHQINHEEQMRRIQSKIATLQNSMRASDSKQGIAICKAAVGRAPQDPALREQLCELEISAGDLAAALTNAQCAVDLLPSNSDDWQQLGAILARQQKYADAAAAFQQSFDLDTENVWALKDLGQSLAGLDRKEAALRAYRRALAIKPRFGPAWLGLGQVLEDMGRKTEADDCYRRALANRIRRGAELTLLARFCATRGWYEAAATNFDDAIKLSPMDADLYMDAGQNFAALAEHREAARRYAVAARLAPDSLPAHFLCGLEWGRDNQPAAAAEEFQEAVRIRPDLAETHLNLGMAYMNAGILTNALAEFDGLLQKNPTNELALRYDRLVREKLATGTRP
ncbi:MAG: tetratricopeptide repeat protein [Verrucomicrobiota bacterium]